MSIENQILLLKIGSWITMPIMGIVAGLIISRFFKNLNDFRNYAMATIYGYAGGIIVVGIFYFIQSTFFPYYKGIDMRWGTVFLNFFIQVTIYYATNLATTWIMIRIRNKK